MAEERLIVPDFNNVDEFASWVEGLDKRAIQKWTADEWVDIYHKIEPLKGMYAGGRDMVSHCPEPFIKLYQNYRMEPAQLEYIRELARQTGQQLATEDIDASRLAIRTQKYYSIEVPDFEDIDDFKKWVAGLDEKEIRRWKVEDWNAVYQKVDNVRAWPDWKYEQKLREEGIAEGFIQEAKLKGKTNRQVEYFNRLCFDHSCKEEFDKLFKNNTLKSNQKDCIMRLMQRYDFTDDEAKLAQYIADRESSIRKVTESVNNITAEGTKYAEGQRVVTSVEVDETIGVSTRGTACHTGRGSSAIKMNPRNVADGAIGTAAHESAHIHFQTGNQLQMELLRKGVVAHPELGRNFAALMMYNSEFYLSPDVIAREYCKENMTKEEWNVYRQKFRGYSHEPKEKLSQIFGLETERAYRKATGQTSERAAMKIANRIGFQPYTVQYSTQGIEMSFRAGSKEGWSAKQLENIIENKFRKNALYAELNMTVDAAHRTVTLTVPQNPGFNRRLDAALEPSKFQKMVKTVDNKINTAINTAISKGSATLNNSKVGKAYANAKTAVANSKAVKKTKEVAQKAKTVVVKTAKKVVNSAPVQKAKTVVKKAGQAVAKSAFGQATKKAVAKTAVKATAKAVGKSLLKKIPLISIGAGLVFGAQRALAGDFAGAAGEVASGVCGTFPGVGTAASVAIDAGLAGRDIYKSTKSAAQTKTQMQKDQKNAKQYSAKKQQQVRKAAKPKTAQKQATAAKMKTNAQKAKTAAKTPAKPKTPVKAKAPAKTPAKKPNPQVAKAKTGGRE